MQYFDESDAMQLVNKNMINGIQGCHQLNVSAVKVNGEMALN